MERERLLRFVSVSDLTDPYLVSIRLVHVCPVGFSPSPFSRSIAKRDRNCSVYLCTPFDDGLRGSHVYHECSNDRRGSGLSERWRSSDRVGEGMGRVEGDENVPFDYLRTN